MISRSWKRTDGWAVDEIALTLMESQSAREDEDGRPQHLMTGLLPQDWRGPLCDGRRSDYCSRGRSLSW